jgi:uncharacterized protein (TIGR02453 family)
MYYITQLYDYLKRLAANNNREWFTENKAEYTELRSLWLADLQRMIDAMAQWEPALKHVDARSCAYRIYRDVRFSFNKEPYKTWFAASMSPYGRKPHSAGYYLQLDPRPGEGGLYGGIWHPEAPLLRKLRNAMIDNIEEFEEATQSPEINRYFPGWCGEMLKTAPKGWDKNHPHVELLRLKDIGKFCPCDEDFYLNPDWPEIAADRLRLLKPFVDFLNYSEKEEL